MKDLSWIRRTIGRILHSIINRLFFLCVGIIKLLFGSKTRTFLFFIILIALLGGWLYTVLKSPSPPSKVNIIARDQTWNLLELYGEEKAVSGFSDDLIRAIAQEENFLFDFALAGPDDLFLGLDAHIYSAILSAKYPYNEELYIASHPYYLLGPVLVVSVDSPIKSIKDINDKIIGVFSDQPTDIVQYPYVIIKYYSYSDLPNPLDDIVSGAIDGVLLNMLQAYQYTHGPYTGQLKVVTSPLTFAGLRVFALRNPTSQKLIEQINQGLQTIKENGTYDALLTKWGLYNPERKR